MVRPPGISYGGPGMSGIAGAIAAPLVGGAVGALPGMLESGPSMHGGLSWLPPEAKLVLGLLTAGSQRREQERAAGESAKRYYEALGNLKGSYDTITPQRYNLASSVYDSMVNQSASARREADAALFGGPRFGLAGPSVQMPEYGGEYVHGGGVPPSTFNPSTRDQRLLGRASSERGVTPLQGLIDIFRGA